MTSQPTFASRARTPGVPGEAAAADPLEPRRHEVSFVSRGVICRAWYYVPAGGAAGRARAAAHASCSPTALG
jgi:hypothetical protein